MDEEIASDNWVKKNKSRIATIVFYLAITFLIYGLLHIIFLLKSEGAECVKNPFTYAANSLYVRQGDQDFSQFIQCSCQAGSEKICFNAEEVSETCWQDGDSYSFNYSNKEINP